MSYPTWRSKEDMIQHIEYLDKQLALSTEREERMRKALEELTSFVYSAFPNCRAKVLGDAFRVLHAPEPNIFSEGMGYGSPDKEVSPALEPVTVEELEEKAYFALANYDSSKEACYLENFNPYRNRTSQAKAVIGYLLSTFTVTRKP